MNELNNLYHLIIENLIDLNRLQGKSLSIKSYLQSLQPDVKRLRSSFHTNHVSVDYSNYNTQAAYLLAYYPHYVEMTYRVLESLQEKDPSLMQLVFDKKHLKVCLFCAGAAPEALGLLSFLRQFYPEVKSIVIYSYDLYSDTWRISQDITKNIINNCFKDYHFALLSHHLDINQIDPFFSIVSNIKDSSIFMFQNCLNEFGKNDKDLKTILENMKFLSENMPSHSFMFINDLRLYTQVNRIIDSIISIINDLNKTNFDDYNEQAFLINKSMEETFKLEQLLAVESNYLKISEIVESYDQKLEEFQTTLQKQKDTIQADLETFKSHLQNLETKNSKQKIKLEEIERRLNRFQEERKNLTRQLERNRKAVIFAILIGLLGVILGVIALFR